MTPPDKKNAVIDVFNDALRALGDGHVPLRRGDRLQQDGSIYLGQYTLRDKHGKSLSKVFNVFAAPESLPEMTYKELMRHLAAMKKWHGHGGADYVSDKAFYQALADRSYKGGWVVPPLEILSGEDAAGNAVTEDNFDAQVPKGVVLGWHWSCTPERGSDSMWCATRRVSDQRSIWRNAFWPNSLALYCRPVRFVECKGPTL